MRNPVERYKEQIKEKKWYERFRDKSKHIILPGFDRTPLYDVVEFFIRGVQQGAITTRASAISFNFFLAIFPSLLFFFTIIPYIPIEGIHTTMLELIKDFMPVNAYKATEETITDIIQHKRGGLLSIGAIMTLYFATNGVSSIISSFNKTIHIQDNRGFIKKRITSLMVFFILATIIILAVALITFSTEFLNFLDSKDIIRSESVIVAIEIGKYLVSGGMVFFSISFIYYMAPAKQFKFRLISAGSTLATLLLLLTTTLFNFYVSNFGSYNALYGSIGTLIVIMLFIYFNALIILIGFELNASINYASRQDLEAKD